MHDDQGTDADLAVLDMALSEALTGRSAPDVWERLAAPAVLEAPRRARGQWLAAALLLLGLGVVVAIATMQRQPTVPPSDALPAAADVDSLATLRERLRDCRDAQVGAEGTWCEATRSWLSFRRAPLDDLFAVGTAPTLEPEQLDAIRAGLANATVDEAADDVLWTHHIRSPEAASPFWLLLRIGGDQPPLVAFAAATRTVRLDAPDFPFEALAPTLVGATQATIQRLGLVLGPDGFAAMATDATKLRLLAVPAARFDELRRFGKVTNLDLASSPEWHTASVLQQLAVRPVESLVLSPAALTRESYAALGALRSLTELFLASDPLLQMVGQRAIAAAPTLDDRAIAHLSSLAQLRELVLAGGTFGDTAFATFAAMPALHSLAMLGCPNVHGVGIEQCRGLTSVLVRGSSLCSDFAQRVATLPALRELHVLDADLQGLAELSRCQQLKQLTLVGRFDRTQLPTLARCAALQRLGLQARPDLLDDDLPLLHGLRQLKSLGITSAAVTEAGRTALRAALPGCRITNEIW